MDQLADWGDVSSSMTLTRRGVSHLYRILGGVSFNIRPPNFKELLMATSAWLGGVVTVVLSAMASSSVAGVHFCLNHARFFRPHPAPDDVVIRCRLEVTVPVANKTVRRLGRWMLVAVSASRVTDLSHVPNEWSHVITYFPLNYIIFRFNALIIGTQCYLVCWRESLNAVCSWSPWFVFGSHSNDKRINQFEKWASTYNFHIKLFLLILHVVYVSFMCY